MLAALLAALMSSLTSIFNSASSMFTMDLWRRFRRHAKQSELMLVGRVCVLVLVAISILWIPIMQQAQSGQLWSYVQAVASYTSPPWCWVFLLALFWKRTTEAVSARLSIEVTGFYGVGASAFNHLTFGLTNTD